MFSWFAYVSVCVSFYVCICLGMHQFTHWASQMLCDKKIKDCHSIYTELPQLSLTYSSAYSMYRPCCPMCSLKSTHVYILLAFLLVGMRSGEQWLPYCVSFQDLLRRSHSIFFTSCHLPSKYLLLCFSWCLHSHFSFLVSSQLCRTASPTPSWTVTSWWPCSRGRSPLRALPSSTAAPTPRWSASTAPSASRPSSSCRYSTTFYIYI